MTETPKTNSAMSRSGPKRNRKPAASRLGEAAVWQPAGGGWKQLYGGYYDLGVSIEWQEFEVPHAFEWSRSFHLDSLELCLNLAGHGSVNCGESTLSFEPLTAQTTGVKNATVSVTDLAGTQTSTLTGTAN